MVSNKFQAIEQYNTTILDEIKQAISSKKGIKALIKDLSIGLDQLALKKDLKITRQLDYFMTGIILLFHACASDAWTVFEMERIAMNLLSRLVDLGALKHAHAMALFIHNSITSSKTRKGYQTTTPSAETFEMLLSVQPLKKPTKILQQLISILMLNVLRIFHGLDKFTKVDLKCEYGPFYWLQKLTKSDEKIGMVMYENYFKTFYKLLSMQIRILNSLDSPDHYLSTSLSCLELYGASASFDVVMLDKLIIQSYSVFAKKHDLKTTEMSLLLLRWFVSLVKLDFVPKFKRVNCLDWLDFAISLAERTKKTETALLFYSMMVGMMESKESDQVDSLIQCCYCNNQVELLLPKEKIGVADSPIIYSVCSKVTRSIQRTIQTSFHNKLSQKDFESLNHLQAIFGYLHGSCTKMQGIASEKLVSLELNILLAESMFAFIQDQSPKVICELFCSALDTAFRKSQKVITEQISTHLYNLGSYYFRLGKESESLPFFQGSFEAKKGFEIELKLHHKILVAYCKCLCRLQYYKNLKVVVLEDFSKFGGSIELQIPLIALYVQAAVCDKSTYSPLFVLGATSQDTLQEELKQLECIESATSKRIQLDLIEMVFESNDLDYDKVALVVKYSTLKREVEAVSSIDMLQDTLQMLQEPQNDNERILIGRIYCETAIAIPQSQESRDLFHKGLGLVYNVVETVPVYQHGAKLLESELVGTVIYHINYFRYLVSFFEIRKETDLMLLSCSIGLRLCSLCNTPAKYALEFYLATSEMYLELGYTGRSAMALELAKQLLRNVEQAHQNQFYISYSNYLLGIRNTEKFQEFRQKIMQDSTHEHSMCLLDSEASILSGAVHQALSAALKAQKYFVKKVNRATQLNGLEMVESLKGFFRSTLLLSRIYVFKGIGNPAEYYLKQGLELATKFDSKFYSLIFTFELIQLNRRKGNYTEANAMAQSLSQDAEQVEQTGDPKTMTESHSAIADLLALDFEKLDIAAEEYGTAMQVVQDFMESPPISQYDAELLQDNQKTKKKQDILSKCLGLESLKSNVLCRHGALLFQTKEIKLAEQKLSLAAKLPMEALDKSLYLSILGRIKLDTFLTKSFPSNKYDMFQESVISVFGKGSNQVTNRKGVTQTTIKLVNQLDNYLRESFEKVVVSGLPHQIKELGIAIVELLLVKKYLDFNIPDLKVLCMDMIYYLNLSGCIFSNRQSNDAHQDWKAIFDKEIAQSIPDNVDVVSFVIDANKDIIYVTRIDSDGGTLVMRLPLTRMATREGSIDGTGYSYSDARNSFDEIMAENKRTTSDAKNCVTAEQRKKWFQNRVSLDKELESFLVNLEKNWVGGFKGLLSTIRFPFDTMPYVNNFKNRIEQLVFKNVCGRLKKKPALIQYDLELCKILLSGGTTTYEDAEDALFYLIDAYQSKGVPIAFDEIDMEEMREDYRDAINLFFKESGFKPSTKDYKSLVLIPDKLVMDFPWECLPLLFGKPVSRLSSFEELRKSIQISNTIKSDHVFTILNPSGDLVKTQEKFEKYIPRSILKSGIVCRQPSRDEFIAGLQKSNLFLYFGHGGGESYLGSQDFVNISDLPVTLLFGCSSGHLKPNGELDLHGISLEYLKHGSPCVLGNLWDVTDVDLDRFAMETLDQWGFNSLSISKQSLVQAVASSRKVCKLPYLVGAAPIVFGLPIFLSQ